MTSDDFETMAMSVDARTAQVFFRDKMYTAEGKLRVIAQEYMTNARDAHREVGRSDTPIDVSLPTTLNPEFIVRDYGLGISPDRMKNVFRIYGATTKDKSNIENGGFGLGAKCGFSYASAFAVATIHKGIKYVYSMYIDDNALNQIATMYTGATDEPDGTEIKIPIRADDIYKFSKWVYEVTQHWLPRPNFKGKEPEYREADAPIDSGVNWSLRSYNRISYISDRSGIWVLADDIPYCIPGDDARACGEVVEKMHDALSHLNLALVLPFKVGELRVYPSRELLYYNDTTKHAIANRVAEAVSAIVSKLQTRLDAATTLAEAVGIWWDCSPVVALAGRLEHPKFKGSSMLRAYTSEETGISVVTTTVKLHGDRRCVTELDTHRDVSFKRLFEPRSFSRKYIVDPGVGEMSLKEVKKTLRDDGKGDCTIVKITDTAKAAAFADFQGFVAAGFKPLQRPPKTPRASSRAEAVFIDTTTVRLRNGTTEKVYLSSDRQRIYFDSIGKRCFVKTRTAEALDDTVITYADVGAMGEMRFSDAMHIYGLVACMDSGLRDLRHRSDYHSISMWAKRFARHVDEDDVVFLPDAIEEVRLKISQLDDKGWRRLIVGGYHRNDYVKAKRWFWDQSMQTGENNASRVRVAIKRLLRDSGRFCEAFHDYVGAMINIEDDDGDCTATEAIRTHTALLDMALGDDIANKARSYVAKIQAVGLEFETMFTAIPELPYLFEALMSTKVGENQRGSAADADLNQFIARLIADKYTASLQHSHINDDAPAVADAPADTTPTAADIAAIEGPTTP